jgi:hypothetical protein
VVARGRDAHRRTIGSMDRVLGMPSWTDRSASHHQRPRPIARTIRRACRGNALRRAPAGVLRVCPSASRRVLRGGASSRPAGMATLGTIGSGAAPSGVGGTRRRLAVRRVADSRHGDGRRARAGCHGGGRQAPPMARKRRRYPRRDESPRIMGLANVRPRRSTRVRGVACRVQLLAGGSGRPLRLRGRFRSRARPSPTS